MSKDTDTQSHKKFNPESIATTSLFVWISSCVFFLLLFYSFVHSNYIGNLELSLIIITVATGIVSFVVAILFNLVDRLQSKKKESIRISFGIPLKKLTGYLFVTCILSLLVFSLNKTRALEKSGFSSLDNSINNTVVQPINRKQSLNDTSAASTRVKPATHVDPDPVISCSIDEKCGGGTKQLRQSVCNNSTCCQIENEWYFYEDKTKCKNDQVDLQPKLITCNLWFGEFKMTESECQRLKSNNTTQDVDYESSTYSTGSADQSQYYESFLSVNDYNKIARENCVEQIRLKCSAQEAELLLLISYGADVQRSRDKLEALRGQCIEWQNGCYYKYPEY